MSGPRCALCHGWLPALLLLALLMLPALPGARLVRGAQPVLCAPCTPERLALCPPVAADCLEAARQPGCGCCQTCALGPGQPCGVYTARCRLGLRCHVPAGEPRPLSSLIQGNGRCLPANVSILGSWQTNFWNVLIRCLRNRQNVWSNNNRRASGMSYTDFIQRLNGPCQKELYRALYKLVKAQQRSRGEIYKFYLPNCNKNGFYHSKQCETLLDGESAACWCVYPKNGRRIPGSPEIKGDPECQQYLSSQE
uniref:Insulin-like growth factor-binding protein 1 n=1 Tax=Corvus moneduloides TaxID=1196302 RepID=A0A8U7MH62_CORMO